jgi:hypothetical protein
MLAVFLLLLLSGWVEDQPQFVEVVLIGDAFFAFVIILFCGSLISVTIYKLRYWLNNLNNCATAKSHKKKLAGEVFQEVAGLCFLQNILGRNLGESSATNILFFSK